jgi:hypothetical protein
MAKALIGLVEKMSAKKPSRFADEGEPEMDARGSGAEGGPDAHEGGEGEEEAGGGGHDEHMEMALDDLADIAGIAPEDRKDFGTALKVLVHACVADAMGGPEPEPEEEGDEEAEPEEDVGPDEE